MNLSFKTKKRYKFVWTSFQLELIGNITKLLCDFDGLKEIPNKLIKITADIREICILDPMNCGKDQAKVRKLTQMLRLWIHNVSQYWMKYEVLHTCIETKLSLQLSVFTDTFLSKLFLFDLYCIFISQQCRTSCSLSCF